MLDKDSPSDSILSNNPSSSEGAVSLNISRDKAIKAVGDIISFIGEDIGRDNLYDTPDRVVTSYEDLFSGYGVEPDSILSKVFKKEYDGSVIINNIGFTSVCEHHMLPFIGVAHVCYYPRDVIVGISKIPRLVEVLSRRMQIQERLTHEIMDAITRVLNPRGVMIVMEALHTCMSVRGVKQENAVMKTIHYSGLFKEDPSLRSDFLLSIAPKS